MPDRSGQVARVYHSPRDYLEAAKAPGADADVLADLATGPYGFVRQAVAEHPHTRADTLLNLIPDELRGWNDHALLYAIVCHAAADDAVRPGAGASPPSAGRRTAALPHRHSAGRPRRTDPELADDLGRRPGASARLRLCC